MSDEPKLNTENGFTIGVFFPKEAPSTAVSRALDRITRLVQVELFNGGEDWDPLVVGYAGDVLSVAAGCECCPPHIYLSTSCFHGDHNYCKRETGLLGNKIPGVCKFCKAPCICRCHRATDDSDNDDNVDG